MWLRAPSSSFSSIALGGFALLGALLLGAGTVACGKPDPDPEIRIGVLIDSGMLAGESTYRGVHMAARALEEDGGLTIDGRPHTVRLLFEETDGSPEGSSRATYTLINQRDVVAMIGSSYSNNAIPTAEIAEQAGVPIVSPGATHPDVTAGRRFAFRVVFTDTLQGKALARFARWNLSAATAAVLFDVANPYSREIAAIFDHEFTDLGGTVVVSESHTGTAENFHRQLAEIAAADPDLLFLPGYNADILRQTRQARDLGIEAIFLGSDGWVPDHMVGKPQVEGAYVGQPWHPTLASRLPVARRFVDLYRDAYGVDPDNLSALAFDAYRLLARAIQDAGLADSSAIRDAIAALEDFPATTGHLRYRGTHGDPMIPVTIVRVDADAIRLERQLGPEKE